MRLGRHATAALLNSVNDSVSYAFDTASVIAIVQNAYASGEFETAKNMLVSENERGCPLGRNRSRMARDGLGRDLDGRSGNRLPAGSDPNTATDLQRR